MSRKQIKLTNGSITKTFNIGFDEFINSCKIKSLRPATIKTYEDSIHYNFYQYFDRNRLISDIDQKVYDEYILFLKAKGRKESGINSSLRHLKTVLNYFIDLGYMDKIEFKKLATDTEIIETYTESELKLLLRKPNIYKCSFIEYRNYTIINVFLGTGCRVSSLINIKVEDLDFENNLILFTHTKKRIQHVVPLSNSLSIVLLEYIKKLNLEPSDWLFTNAFGEKLSRFSVNYSIDEYCKKRGIIHSGLHKFRHSFAKLWVENGGDILKLSKILQHSRLDMTQHYVNLFAKDIKDFNDFNPLEKLQEIQRKKIKLK